MLAHDRPMQWNPLEPIRVEDDPATVVPPPHRGHERARMAAHRSAGLAALILQTASLATLLLLLLVPAI